MTLLFAFILDAFVGYPAWLYTRIRHPVVWMGAGISLLEANFNQSRFSETVRRVLGVVTMAILLTATVAIALLIQRLGLVVQVVAMASLLASRSLYDHVHAVLVADSLEEARQKVAHIVGRDVATLDEAGVCRAAIESLAESFGDGVVAPFFWAGCLGLPGIACYKLINTADSMIGHKDERYRAFGWAAARLDDVANFIPARLAGVLIALASCSRDAWKIMWRDAGKHASPNAGWPESAMAGALGLQLGGANSYDGVVHESAAMGDGTRMATNVHLGQALRLYVVACITLTVAWLAIIFVL